MPRPPKTTNPKTTTLCGGGFTVGIIDAARPALPKRPPRRAPGQESGKEGRWANAKPAQRQSPSAASQEDAQAPRIKSNSKDGNSKDGRKCAMYTADGRAGSGRGPQSRKRNRYPPAAPGFGSRVARGWVSLGQTARAAHPNTGFLVQRPLWQQGRPWREARQRDASIQFPW